MSKCRPNTCYGVTNAGELFNAIKGVRKSLFYGFSLEPLKFILIF